MQETMLGNSNIPCPKEYIPCHSEFIPENRNHGGAMLMIRHDIPHVMFSLQTRLQAVAVQIYLDRRYTVCSLYLPPGIPFPVDDFNDLVNQLPTPFLILGDMNARNPRWGDILCNQRGNQLASVVDNLDLGILNTGEPTHFHVQTGTLSAIDLTICSNDAILDFNWGVMDDRYTSDHFPIIVSVAQSPPVSRLPKWNIEKAKWKIFMQNSSIDAVAEEFPLIDDAIEFLNTTLFTAGLLSVPRTTGNFARRPVPWWNRECKIAHKAMRAAKTRYRRHKCDYYKVQYNKARAQFRLKIKKSRKGCWTMYLNSINSKTPLSLIWKKIRKIAGKYVPCKPPIIKINNVKIADPQTVAESLSNHFAEVSKKNNDRPYADYREREEQKNLDFTPEREETYNIPFSMNEFESALANAKDTAPGPDDIPYAMLKHIPLCTKIFILGIINRIFIEHLYPMIWELARVLPFVKPGKDGLLVTSYRPIALTSCLCKLMEKMVNSRLMWYLERNNYLSSAQCGFRKMHSTTDVLVRMENSICEAFASKQHHITVFFDLEKAYDTTWRHGILQDLHDCNLRGELPLFIKAFIKTRRFQVQVGAMLSSVQYQEEGVPQGSVLSVTLFALAINGIAKVIPKGIFYTLFVDDFSLSFAATKMVTAERQMQLTINKVVIWAEKHGFKFSTTKTVVVHFCRIRGIHPDPDLFINQQRIPCVTETKFLGVIFDNKLNWSTHLSTLKVRCMKAMDILKVLSHSSWGADRTQLLRLYKALILPKLTYGCEVYTSASDYKLKTLNSVHNAGIRIATGAFKSSPIESMLVDASEKPLELHLHSMLLRSWIRFQRLPNSPTSIIIRSEKFFAYYRDHPKMPKPFHFRVKEILRNLNLPIPRIMPHKQSAISPWRLPEVKFCRCLNFSKKDIPGDNIRLLFLEHAVEHENYLPVYTDGSKSDAGVGFGAVFPDAERSGSLNESASIFTAELYAILIVLKEILIRNDKNFVIYSDSLSALQALNFNSTHPLVLEILEWIFLLNRKNKMIKFCWVPAHVGVTGNERVDEIAKNAITTSAQRDIALPFRDFFPNIRKVIRNKWQEIWGNLNTNKKMLEITNSVVPWRYNAMPRRWETALCRLRIGHTRLTHGFLMADHYEPYCDDCLVPLTVRHLLVECPSLGDLRVRYLSDSKDGEGQYVLSKILGESVTFNTSGVFKFIDEAGLLNKI